MEWWRAACLEAFSGTLRASDPVQEEPAASGVDIVRPRASRRRRVRGENLRSSVLGIFEIFRQADLRRGIRGE